jgi:hypothetical protein
MPFLPSIRRSLSLVSCWEEEDRGTDHGQFQKKNKDGRKIEAKKELIEKES